jgi:uncharacterized membrane protein
LLETEGDGGRLPIIAIAGAARPRSTTEPTVETVAGQDRINPLHAVLLGFPTSFFVAAFVSDITLLTTAEIQWSNFSSWLIAGGLLCGGFGIAWGLASVLRRRGSAGRGKALLHLALLLLMWIVGFINALLHGRDAWYSVTATGAVLSAITALLALAAGWLAYTGFDRREKR